MFGIKAKTVRNTAKCKHEHFFSEFSLKCNVALPDLANNNIGYLINFECQIRNKMFLVEV